jgi:hypothetical protein
MIPKLEQRLMVLDIPSRLGEMGTEGAPNTRTGKLKEEAGRPANYLAKTHLHFDFGKQSRLNLAKTQTRLSGARKIRLIDSRKFEADLSPQVDQMFFVHFNH